MTAPAAAFERLSTPEKQEMHTAADLAVRLFPGPVGELLRRELLVMVDFGHRFGTQALSRRLVRHLHDEQVRRDQAERDRVAEWARVAFRGSESAAAGVGSGRGVYPPQAGSSPYGDARGLYGASVSEVHR